MSGNASLPPVLVMGVQGAGKSTIGSQLAARLNVTFIDGDSLHPAENVAAMAAGQPLTDEQRTPWLRQVGRVLAEQRECGVVVACSALKRRYRDLLREFAPDLFVVYPEGTRELIAARISARQHEYMPPALLQSQFDILQPLQRDESGIIVDISRSPREITDALATALHLHTEERKHAEERNE
ncbi:MAG: transferase [Homoserinimonas sp.]|jgi:gluconokinase|nr:transferase [Homoserinimonas sp.]